LGKRFGGRDLFGSFRKNVSKGNPNLKIVISEKRGL